MVVINEVLVIGKRVRCFHVTVGHAVAVIDDLEHWGNAIGGARCGGEDLIVIGNSGIVDAKDDVFNIALARRGQQHAGHALGLQVLGQAFLIAPNTGVIHQNGVVDAVLGVIDRGRVVGVDHLDLRAIGPDNLFFLVHADGAVEGTVDGIAAQEAGALDDVPFALIAHHNRAQAHAAVSGFASDEDAGKEAADAAKAVQHDIGWVDVLAGTDDFREFIFEVAAQVIFARLFKAQEEASDVDGRGA